LYCGGANRNCGGPLITRTPPEIEVAPLALAGREFLSDRVIAVLLFVGTCLYLLAFRRVTNMDPDEGIVLQGAERILHGQVPYRDFFTFYTPGAFYLTAFALRIFGDSFAVARALIVLFGASFSTIAYVLARRTSSRGVSLLIGVLVAVTSTPYRFLVLHNWESTFWACICVYFAVRWLETSTTGYAFATGSLAAFTFLSEQSKGAGLCCGILLALGILGCRGRSLPRIWPFIGGFAWPFAATLVYFFSQRALRAMLVDLLWPFRHYSAANRVPYGDQNWSDHARDVLFHTGPLGVRVLKAIAVSPGFVVPILPLIAAALLIYWTRHLHQVETKPEYYVLMCSVLTGLLFSVILVRADIIHFTYLVPLFYLVLAWILDGRDLHAHILPVVRKPILVFVIVAFGIMGAALFFSARSARNRIETRRGVVFTREVDSVLAYASAQTAPEEKILVYPYLPLYYYLSGTQSASRYEYFQPGMSTPEQARAIIDSLKSNHVRTVFFEPAFADKIPASWPGTPMAAIAGDAVADYVARNYRVCAVLQSAAGWDFLAMRRSDSSC
jgi:4-amino-4-deoxy-L-arabinose transferase-like glycosyltransferase